MAMGAEGPIEESNYRQKIENRIETRRCGSYDETAMVSERGHNIDKDVSSSLAVEGAER